MADAAPPTGDIRSSILAEIAASKDSGNAAPVEPAPAPAEPTEATEPAEPAAEVEASAEPEVEAEPEEPTDVEESETPDDDDDADFRSDDPETQKRLDQVRRVDKRRREAHARREAEFEAQRRELQPKIERLAEIERLAARIKYDPVAVLRAFGVSADDYELVAQSIYAESPALASDPKQKAAAQSKLRERERDDKHTATEKKIAELEAKLEQQQQQAKVQAEAAAYVQQLNVASAKFPLVAHMLKADAEDTHDALVATYGRLEQKLQRQPKPAEVIAEYDRKERARLAKLGVDPATIGKPVAKKPAVNGNKATPPVAAKPADPAKPAQTNGAVQRVDDRDAILAEIASLRASQT